MLINPTCIHKHMSYSAAQKARDLRIEHLKKWLKEKQRVEKIKAVYEICDSFKVTPRKAAEYLMLLEAGHFIKRDAEFIVWIGEG